MTRKKFRLVSTATVITFVIIALIRPSGYDFGSTDYLLLAVLAAMYDRGRTS